MNEELRKKIECMTKKCGCGQSKSTMVQDIKIVPCGCKDSNSGEDEKYIKTFKTEAGLVYGYYNDGTKVPVVYVDNFVTKKDFRKLLAKVEEILGYRFTDTDDVISCDPLSPTDDSDKHECPMPFREGNGVYVLLPNGVKKLVFTIDPCQPQEVIREVIKEVVKEVEVRVDVPPTPEQIKDEAEKLKPVWEAEYWKNRSPYYSVVNVSDAHQIDLTARTYSVSTYDIRTGNRVSTRSIIDGASNATESVVVRYSQNTQPVVKAIHPDNKEVVLSVPPVFVMRAQDAPVVEPGAIAPIASNAYTIQSGRVRIPNICGLNPGGDEYYSYFVDFDRTRQPVKAADFFEILGATPGAIEVTRINDYRVMIKTVCRLLDRIDNIVIKILDKLGNFVEVVLFDRPAPKRFTLTATSNIAPNVVDNPTRTVTEGSSEVFSISSDTYEVVRWTRNGQTVSNDPIYTATNLMEGDQIRVEVRGKQVTLRFNWVTARDGRIQSVKEPGAIISRVGKTVDLSSYNSPYPSGYTRYVGSELSGLELVSGTTYKIVGLDPTATFKYDNPEVSTGPDTPAPKDSWTLTIHRFVDGFPIQDKGVDVPKNRNTINLNELIRDPELILLVSKVLTTDTLRGPYDRMVVVGDGHVSVYYGATMASSANWRVTVRRLINDKVESSEVVEIPKGNNQIPDSFWGNFRGYTNPRIEVVEGDHTRYSGSTYVNGDMEIHLHYTEKSPADGDSPAISLDDTILVVRDRLNIDLRWKITETEHSEIPSQGDELPGEI